MSENKRFEDWKEVVGYEGYYKVNRLGEIVSLPRTVSVNDNGRCYTKLVKGRVLKQVDHSAGYKLVPLTKDGKTKLHFVHRLVAEAFIPNPKNLPCVNHRDEDKTNNCEFNLEWCTYEYNNNYGTAHERATAKKTGVSLTLTDDDILYIRIHYIPNDREYGTRGLGRKFGVSHHTIRHVLSEECYRGR